MWLTTPCNVGTVISLLITMGAIVIYLAGVLNVLPTEERRILYVYVACNNYCSPWYGGCSSDMLTVLFS